MTSCTDEQLRTLLDYLADHRDLAIGLLRSADGRRRSKLLWDEISQQLNSLGGSCKTTQQWQKVWSDRKYLAKKNAALVRRSFAATGGGEVCPSLAPWELSALNYGRGIWDTLNDGTSAGNDTVSAAGGSSAADDNVSDSRTNPASDAAGFSNADIKSRHSVECFPNLTPVT